MSQSHTPDGDTQVALFQLRSRARTAEIERRSRANQTLDETEAIHREIIENYRRLGEQNAGRAQPVEALSPTAPAEHATGQARVARAQPEEPPQVSVVSWAWFVFSPVMLLPPFFVVGAVVALMGTGAIWGAVHGDVNSGVALASVAAFSVAGLLGLVGTVLSIAITAARAKVSRTELYWRRAKKRTLSKSR
ncbi:MAG: hypothetical protein JNM58_17460 [Xanthomonadaceae bacterium]|nr:hypothetical protein [Xanthomonadaceae bacterium]